MTGKEKATWAGIRRWIKGVLGREAEPYGEELDLLLEQELISERDKSSPARKRASLLGGAERLLAQGYPRHIVSVIYGDAATREAEGLLAPDEWDAATRTILNLSSKLRDVEALESEAVS